MEIILGKTQVSMLNPPNEGTVKDKEGRIWNIKGGSGGIVLKNGFECHPDFVNGMDMVNFCWWINDKFE
jgi:hypothetical protein